MKLVVFGSTGKSGQQVVEQALAAAHLVTAFARNPAAVTTRHPNLKVVQGDALDAARVAEAVAGQNAVLSAIGANRRSILTICTDATRNIIGAMQEHGVRRLIVLSAYAA